MKTGLLAGLLALSPLMAGCGASMGACGEVGVSSWWHEPGLFDALKLGNRAGFDVSYISLKNDTKSAVNWDYPGEQKQVGLDVYQNDTVGFGIRYVRISDEEANAIIRDTFAQLGLAPPTGLPVPFTWSRSAEQC
jgi:hypothetical protein